MRKGRGWEGCDGPEGGWGQRLCAWGAGGRGVCRMDWEKSEWGGAGKVVCVCVCLSVCLSVCAWNGCDGWREEHTEWNNLRRHTSHVVFTTTAAISQSLSVTCQSTNLSTNVRCVQTIRGRCEGKCEVTVESRSYCKKCRLAKCFTVGMKKELILSEYC